MTNVSLCDDSPPLFVLRKSHLTQTVGWRLCDLKIGGLNLPYLFKSLISLNTIQYSMWQMQVCVIYLCTFVCFGSNICRLAVGQGWRLHGLKIVGSNLTRATVLCPWARCSISSCFTSPRYIWEAVRVIHSVQTGAVIVGREYYSSVSCDSKSDTLISILYCIYM